MKYCLTVSKNTVLEGYEMVPVHPNIGFDINNKIQDATATEIVAEMILPHFYFKDQEKILLSLAQKLRQGGKLVVSCIDIDLVRETLPTLNNMLTINSLLYGEDTPIKSISDVTLIRETLTNLGLTITNIRFNECQVVVTAKR